MEVSSDNDATSRWLSEGLVCQEHINGHEESVSGPWWSYQGAQSDYGMLLSVGHGKSGPRGGNNLTELLLYAAVKEKVAELPTTLLSSSPAPPEDLYRPSIHEDHLDIKVYALPLCSRFLDYVDKAAGLALPTQEDLTTSREAIFLPQSPDLSHFRQEAHQKRPSLSALFEDATQKRRKLKARGGERISKAMAEVDRPATSHGLSSGLDQEEAETPPMLQARKAATRNLSSSSSMMSATPELPRPVSRSGALANGKRSSLHRVESATSPRNSPLLSDVDGGDALKNKDALTKVVMAGMRLYGLQQKKKSGKSSAMENRPNTAISIGDAMPPETEDEFKLVYHQTFKAAMFACRRHFDVQAISQDVMRDIVDRILSLFCSDPLVGLETEGGLTTFGMSSQKSAGAFDESRAGQSSMPGSVWSPHIVKKRLLGPE